MKKRTVGLIALLLALVAGNAQAETLQQYVSDCKAALGLSAAATLPALDCNNGVRFAGGAGGRSLINDFVGSSRISDYVDVTFACRWLRDANGQTTGAGPFTTAASLELLIHNRQNGNTCFFAAKPTNTTDLNGVSTSIVSLTASNASTYWYSPTELNTVVPSTGGVPGGTLKCVGCHAAGAYIASVPISSALGQFGLLNNGHDTLNARYKAVNSGVAGSAFYGWNSIKDGLLSSGGCSGSCHVIGNTAPTPCPSPLVKCPLPGISGFSGQPLIPSLANDIQGVITAGVMSPAPDGNYGTINLSIPLNGYELETYADARASTAVPSASKILGGCGAPGYMEAHVAGSANKMLIVDSNRFASLPDRFSVFNARDGLVCLNADQEPGTQCQNYSVHYECTTATGAKSWTTYQSNDSPASGDGDREPRPSGICPGGLTVTGIEAQFTWAPNGWVYSSFGPNDRLSRLSQYGLSCFNSDQSSGGQCSNYVVQFGGCQPVPIIQFKTLTSVFVTGKQLTGTSNNLAKGQAHNNSWNTQLWIIEPVTDTEYFRLRNNGTLAYLTVVSSAESAIVGTAPSVPNSGTQQWVIEPVSGASDFRLRNVGSGKYLTIADPKNVSSGEADFLPIYSQGRNTSWTSQRWLIQ